VDAIQQQAEALLEQMRRTPMRRGGVPRGRRHLQSAIAAALVSRRTPPDLARRIAFQLVFKFEEGEISDPVLWHGVGDVLCTEIAQLKSALGLGERQIVTVLPKLSPVQLRDYYDELVAADRRVARTILNASLEAADPVATGHQYLTAYRRVVAELEGLDSRVARTLANATFTAGAPVDKAVVLHRHLVDLSPELEDDPAASRIVAKATVKSGNPAARSKALIQRYKEIVADLIAGGIEPHVARSLAGLRRSAG
jgi:hypothetical protein